MVISCLLVTRSNSASTRLAYAGDLVIVAVGVFMWNCGVVPEKDGQAVLSQNCNKATLEESVISPQLAAMTMQTELIRLQFRDGLLIQPDNSLSLTDLKQVHLPLPPLSEQETHRRRGGAAAIRGERAGDHQ